MDNKFNFLRNSIKAKLIALMLLIAIVPLIVVGLIYFNISKKTIIDENVRGMSTALHLRKEMLLTNLTNNVDLLKVTAASEETYNAYNQLKKFHKQAFNLKTGNLNYHTDEYEKVAKGFEVFLLKFQKIWGFNNIYILGNDNGHVHYASDRGDELGKNLNIGEYKNSPLAKIWNQLKTTNRPALIDYSLVGKKQIPYAYMGVPIIQNNQTTGFLVVRLDSDRINKILGEASVNKGSTHEIFLIGEDLLMRSKSKFIEGETILRKKVETISKDLVFSGNSGHLMKIGYRGKEVLTTYNIVDLKSNPDFYADFDWAIISQIDKSEIFVPIQKMRNTIFLLIVLFAIVAVILAYFFSRGIANPIVRLSAISQNIGTGDLISDIPDSKRSDEIGFLHNSFKTMKTNLRSQILQITEAVNILSSSVAEISTTISQLAASTTETVTSINQTTTTMQEVKQTAQVARERATEVIENSERNMEASEKGETAVNANKEGIMTIQQQMDHIAQSIVKLSEQGRAIGFIMDTINDLSEQSNLLAVNAAIEAAKAGEEGKGFGVVAGEIKNLANQSKKATAEVRDILSDIQKATSNAVMSTEEGNKAVDKGLIYSENAVESITLLTDVLNKAVTAANQIGASSQQQFVGIDQVTVAMQNINEASKQNLEGSKQLEIAADRLNELGKKLKDMVSSYKV